MSGRWKPSKGSESKKLGSSPGWALGSSLSSSSGSSSTRSTRAAKKEIALDLFGAVLSPLTTNTNKRDREELDDDELGGEDEQSTNTNKKKRRPPQPTRVAMESDMLKNMMQHHIFCPKCSEPVIVSFPTVCVASGCRRIECGNKLCDFVDVDKPTSANVALPDDCGSPLITRSTDYCWLESNT